MTHLLLAFACLAVLSCSQTAPPIDTPATLPPAEPPADVTRNSPDEAADSGKPGQQVDDKPAPQP